MVLDRTHTGYGIYGAPSGRRVRMWGISHFAIEGGKIVEDWTMFNEFFVLQQILRDAVFNPRSRTEDSDP